MRNEQDSQPLIRGILYALPMSLVLWMTVIGIISRMFL